MIEERYFTNDYEDYDYMIEPNQFSFEKYREKLHHLITVLISEVSPDVPDMSMYTGLTGIGLFYYHVLSKSNISWSKSLLEKVKASAVEIIKRLPQNVDTVTFSKNVSVFTSQIGSLYLRVLLKNEIPHLSPCPDRCFEFIISAYQCTLDVKSSMPDEALYGRVGYLACLLSLKAIHCDVPVSVVDSVVDAIIRSGKQTAKRCLAEMANIGPFKLNSFPPLMFEWHNKVYIGGAHGFAGILTVLLKVRQSFPGVISDSVLKELILPTVTWVSELQLPSGNYPSSLGKSMVRDELVHWCHGATGVVPLLTSAYKVTNKFEFMQRALRAGEVIWSKGLLRKGCGLCHGSAGSGYALIDIYNTTKDPKYLYRACKFAEWCTDCFTNRTRIPDHPLSLFEGFAGTLYFLVDMVDPENAKFPLLSGI